jgi:hypothetical protein
MAQTTEITEGIKVIKINKIDLEGRDNTISLQSLEYLRLKLSDDEIVEFKILSISESPDFYTFFVEPNDIFDKSISTFINIDGIAEGLISSGIYQITPPGPNNATFTGYSIDSIISGSVESGGYFNFNYPSKVDVQVDVVFSQSSGPDNSPLFVYLTGSGIQEFSPALLGLEGTNAWETRSVTIPLDLSLINNSNEIEQFRVGVVSNLGVSNLIALNTAQTRVYISQSSFVFEDNTLQDATLSTTANSVRTLTAGNAPVSMSTWDFVGGTYYTFPGVNNLGPLEVTCSFNAYSAFGTGTGNANLKIDFVSDSRGILNTETYGLGSGTSFPSTFYYTLSQSFYPVNVDEQFYIQVSNTASSGFENARIRSGSWEINQIQSPQQPSVLNVFEPYLTDNFSNSDCNPLINNALTDRVNEFYMDVDYTSNAIIAVNADQILSGSATRANVQYSNYTTARVVNPRYKGSKNTSPDINELEGNNLPVIEQTKAFFLYNRGGNFNTIADRSGSALYTIGFMIDDQGNTYEPQESESAYLPNLLSAFGQGSKVTFVPTDTGSQVAGTYDVHFPARKIKPIIYSDTGSLGNDYLVSGSYSTIEFIPDPNQYNQFDTFVTNTSNITVSSNSSKRYEPSYIFNDQASGWGFNKFGQYQYYVSQSSNVLATIDIDLECTNAASSGTFAVKLYKSGSSTPISTTSVPRSTNSGEFNLDITKTVKLQEGDAYYVEVENTSSGNLTIKNFDIINDLPHFRLAPLTSTISVTTSDSWLTGSSNTTSVITASQDLAKAYNYIQANIPDSGFQYPILFNLQQYDEIRYNGAEEKVKLIDRVDYEVDVTADPTEFNLHVHFTEPVDMSTIDKDYYVFRRNEFQKDTMIVNTPGSLMEKGFILPEYQTPELKANLSDIIQDLTDKGLISND